MKRTMIFLPKFFYAAIFIFVVFGLMVLGAGQGLSEEGQIQKQQSNHRQTKSNGGLQVEIDDGIAKISDDWFHDSNFLNMNATNKQIVATIQSVVNQGVSMKMEREISAAGGEISAGSGFAGAVDEGRKTNQNDRQKQDGHSQIDNRQFTHNDLFVNRMAVNQELTATAPPNNTMPKEVLSNMAGITIEPTATRPKPTRISTMVLNWRGESTGFWGTRTNNSSAIKRNGNTAGGWLSILASKAYAAETVSAKPIPLSLYQPLAGQIMFREALEKLPVEQRTPEKIAELITGISQLLSSFPAKGEIFSSGGKFSGLTGTAGILSGKVVKGTYRIKIDPVEGIDLIVPAAVEAGLHGSETVMIGLTPGKGKVRTAGETGGWKNIFQGLGKKVSRMMGKTVKTEDSQVLGTQFRATTGEALPTAPLTIQLFRDENKNGVYDSGESLVEWAGVKMDLEPLTQSITYNLTEGWNLIAFPVAPTSVTTAAEAVQDIAKEGGYVTTISTWEGDKWIEYSQRGLEKFGHDFGLVPGRAYFLESQMNSVWTVAGTPLPAENQVIQLRKGWNGVGIPKEGVTAVQILDELQAVGEVSQTSPCEVCETAEQAAKWNFGLWDVVVKRRYSPEHHEVYGRDFPVKDTEGYFIHANEEATWTVDGGR